MQLSSLPLLRRHWPLALLSSLLGLALLWGALWPLGGGSHELLLEVPPGARGVPAEVRLTAGVRDVLLLRNRSGRPLVFGPLQLAPGAQVRLPFGEEGEQAMPMPILQGGVLRVRVVPMPSPGWERLRWRFGNLGDAVRTLPLQGPD
ncbi:hypothetical protein LQ564_02985 [Massilia sp. G4R7]|uniref:Copper chaperone PCu(A)C n=1 Tax=Massilia phyllostachyos TaxID=2898585 RepID=A0ABS8Q0L1_9BURK|nr:hypothetical protein [Massilia phyllostachyos]